MNLHVYFREGDIRRLEYRLHMKGNQNLTNPNDGFGKISIQALLCIVSKIRLDKPSNRKIITQVAINPLV